MDIQKKIDELGHAFEEFKKINDQKIEEIKKGSSGAESKEKLERCEKHLDILETQIKEMNAALARTGGQGGDQKTKETEQRKQEFNAFLRKGQHAAHDGAFAGKTLSIDSEVGGGFFVLPEVSAEIVKKVNESSPMRQLASVVTISTSSFKVNSDLDARTANWQGERSSRSEGTSPTINQDEIFVHEMDCNPGATQAFLDDAFVNVEAWLADYAAEAFALAEATAFISGHGVGRPRGVLSYGDGTTYGNVQRITTDATGAITGDDLIDVQDALKEPYQKNATWLMHRLTKSVIRKVKDGTQYLWQPGLQAGAPDMLLGRPVMLAADLNTSLATGTDGLMLYGDFKQCYQIVDRVGIRTLRDPYSSKPKVVFYTTKRVGGGVKNYEAVKVLKIM